MVNGLERKVYKLKDGKIIKEYNSMHEAVVEMLGEGKGYRNDIWRAIKLGKIWKGFNWMHTPEDDLEGEFWIDHPWLQVKCSNLGRVQAVNGYKTFGSNAHHGYKIVGVNRRMFRVHRLIAEAFLENPEGKPLVDHVDFNTSNNEFTNLRWFTHKENTLHTRKNPIPHTY
jgi:hypothetical protein